MIYSQYDNQGDLFKCKHFSSLFELKSFNGLQDSTWSIRPHLHLLIWSHYSSSLLTLLQLHLIFAIIWTSKTHFHLRVLALAYLPLAPKGHVNPISSRSYSVTLPLNSLWKQYLPRTLYPLTLLLSHIISHSYIVTYFLIIYLPDYNSWSPSQFLIFTIFPMPRIVLIKERIT